MNLANIPAPRQRRRKGSTAPSAVGLAAVYVRVSTDEQEGSLESQERACRAEAAKRGLDVAAVYTDEGYSGGTLDRPALVELRAAVGAGEVAVVIVFSVDRLSRRQADVLALLEEFAAAGAGIVSASQPFETTTPMGRAMIGFLSIFAELQREEIRQRTRVALQRKIAEGKPVGRTPYGVRIAGDGDGKHYAANSATWPIVERILAERASGRSCQWIANGLNREGIANPSARGIWSAATVAALCRSRAVRQVAQGAT
jgi:DNA invertase Pin-like site-specific DNA recombinase